MNYKDCYAEYDARSGRLVLGNARVKKTLYIQGGLFRVDAIEDLSTGDAWRGDAPAWQRFPLMEAEEAPEIRFECAAIQGKPCVSDHLKAVILARGRAGRVWYESAIFPDIPFVCAQMFLEKTGDARARAEARETPRCDGIESARGPEEGAFVCGSDTLECVPLSRGHYRVESVWLRDKTDIHDGLVSRAVEPVYARGTLETDGSLFCLSEIPGGKALLFVKHAPVPGSALNRRGSDFAVMGNRRAILSGNGVDFQNLPPERIPCYASALGVARAEAMYAEFWRYSTALSLGDARRKLFVMSNTWGDRSQDMAISEAFLMRELARAKELGVDIVQIDDGWENGVTANSLRKKGGAWEGFYSDTARFWDVNRERFPRGLAPIAQKAREYHLELGLWFAPDSSGDFENVDKDIQTLWNLYQEYGVRYFKLDGVKIRSKTGEARFIRLLETLTDRSGGEIRFNLDVTAEDRFGYLYETRFGTLFVENRYTDFGNYYPHNTFKNLWDLAGVVPARRLQMEFLNPRRNARNYAGMAFAPANYRMDYLFATVVPANPLAWMELCHLSDADAAALQSIRGVYGRFREALFRARVVPIGERPDGTRFSGYLCLCGGGEAGHLLLFREETREDAFLFQLPFACARLETLYATGEARCEIAPGGVRATMREPRSFVWLRYERA